MTERAQREHKRQVGVQRIQIASEARVHTEVGDAGQAEDHQRVQQHALFRLGRPVDIAECRRERDAEQRNGNGVAKGQRRVQSCQEHLLFLEGVFKVRILDVVEASARNGQLGTAGHDERFRRDRLDML